ncbi:hypothetical protein BBJ28_00025227, partial [Nothophytophthora sp. Chile5]
MNRPTRGKKKRKKGKGSKTEKTRDANVSDALGFRLPKSPNGRVEDYDVIWGIGPGPTDFITASNQEGKSTLGQTIEFMLEYGRELLEFFMDPFFRKLKFRRYTLRTAQLDRACFELAGSPGTKTIIGFGDCGAAGEGLIKNSPAGPVKSFARKLAQYCEVVVVDKF